VIPESGSGRWKWSQSVKVPIADTTSPRALQSNHHTMMGSTDDPKDGKAVAGSIFAAVVVYAVGLSTFFLAVSFILLLLLCCRAPTDAGNNMV